MILFSMIFQKKVVTFLAVVATHRNRINPQQNLVWMFRLMMFHVHQEDMKRLEINQTKDVQNLYIKKYKVLLGETKENLNRDLYFIHGSGIDFTL